MLKLIALAAFVGYQVVGAATALVIIVHHPVAVLLGALGVGVPFLVARHLWLHYQARRRIKHRLAYH